MTEEIKEDTIQGITGETTDAKTQTSEDTTPTDSTQTVQEYEEEQDNKLGFDTSKDKDTDIIIEDEY